jgi:hypothetical protein
MDPLAIVEEKYHAVVTLGYSLILAIIVWVLKMTSLERWLLWLAGVIFLAAVLRTIRKGVDGPKQFDLGP